MSYNISVSEALFNFTKACHFVGPKVEQLCDNDTNYAHEILDGTSTGLWWLSVGLTALKTAELASGLWHLHKVRQEKRRSSEWSLLLNNGGYEAKAPTPMHQRIFSSLKYVNLSLAQGALVGLFASASVGLSKLSEYVNPANCPGLGEKAVQDCTWAVSGIFKGLFPEEL